MLCIDVICYDGRELKGTLVGRDLELDIGTQFTGFTGTNVQILTDGSGDSACQNHAASSLTAAP
jgi:hypothetical protein